MTLSTLARSGGRSARGGGMINARGSASDMGPPVGSAPSDATHLFEHLDHLGMGLAELDLVDLVPQ
jgi:hypothetical protein